MDFPSWLDEDILSHPVTWLFLGGGWIAFLLGFKGASNGLFGIATSNNAVPVLTLPVQILIMLLWPVIVYFFMMFKLR